MRKTTKQQTGRRSRRPSPASGSDAHCDVCQREQERCCCNGIQTYAMSNYPGEHRLVRSHPGNRDDEQWYRREDVDALLKKLRYVHPNERGQARRENPKA